jgi:predicted nucleic acid-binding protein
MLDLLDPPAVQETKRQTTAGTVTTAAADADRYLEKALTAELKLMARAPEGERNKQLFESAVSLLRFVADGRLPTAAVTEDLRDAANSAGLPDIEITRTLKSAAARRGITL